MVFLITAGKSSWTITRIEAAKMKQNAVIISMGLHCGIMLSRRTMLNNHPTSSRILKTYTITIGLNAGIRNECGNLNEYLTECLLQRKYGDFLLIQEPMSLMFI